MVERQLQSILYIERVSNLGSLSRMKMDGKWFLGKISGGRGFVGIARVLQGPEKQQRYSRMTKIMTRTKAATRSSDEFGNLSGVLSTH